MKIILNETDDDPVVTPVAGVTETVIVEGAANYAPAGPEGPQGAAGITPSYVQISFPYWYRSLGHSMGNGSARNLPVGSIGFAPFDLPAGTYDSASFRVSTAGVGSSVEVLIYSPTGLFLGSLGAADCSTVGYKTVTGQSVQVGTSGQLIVGLRALGSQCTVWGYRAAVAQFPTHTDFEYSVVGSFHVNTPATGSPIQQINSLNFGNDSNQIPIIALRRSA